MSVRTRLSSRSMADHVRHVGGAIQQVEQAALRAQGGAQPRVEVDELLGHVLRAQILAADVADAPHAVERLREGLLRDANRDLREGVPIVARHRRALDEPAQRLGRDAHLPGRGRHVVDLHAHVARRDDASLGDLQRRVAAVAAARRLGHRRRRIGHRRRRLGHLLVRHLLQLGEVGVVRGHPGGRLARGRGRFVEVRVVVAGAAGDQRDRHEQRDGEQRQESSHGSTSHGSLTSRRRAGFPWRPRSAPPRPPCGTGRRYNATAPGARLGGGSVARWRVAGAGLWPQCRPAGSSGR